MTKCNKKCNKLYNKSNYNYNNVWYFIEMIFFYYLLNNKRICKMFQFYNSLFGNNILNIYQKFLAILVNTNRYLNDTIITFFNYTKMNIIYQYNKFIII